MRTKKTKEEKEKELESKIKSLNKFYKYLPAKQAERKRKALAKALLSLKKPIEETLKEYREAIEAKGYYGVNAKIAPIVEAYGTIEDRIELIVNGYFDMKYDLYDKQKIEQASARSLMDSVSYEGDYKAVWDRYVYLYERLRDTIEPFNQVKDSYMESCYTAIAYLTKYEWMKLTEHTLSYVKPLIDEAKIGAFTELTESLNSYLIENAQRELSLNKEGTGYEFKGAEDLLNFAKEVTELLELKMAQYKAAIETINEWAKENGMERAMPMGIKQNTQIITFKDDNFHDIPKKYFKRNLRELERAGKVPTEEEKKLALFPIYDETEPDKSTRKVFLSYLNKK